MANDNLMQLLQALGDINAPHTYDPEHVAPYEDDTYTGRQVSDGTRRGVVVDEQVLTDGSNTATGLIRVMWTGSDDVHELRAETLTFLT